MPTIHHGDCIQVMKAMPPESVDAIVTDPPYGLGFMGRKWDSLPPSLEWAEACYRVLKPGGHIAAFGGTRTWHRLAVAIEDAGFEMRDSLAWLYGSGFPKSHDVGKAIDKVNGEAGRLHKFTAWMRTTGITARQLNEATGTNMGGHYLTAASQPAIPTPDLWAKIRPLVGEVPDWVDELVERIEAEREILHEKPAFGIGGKGTYNGHAEGATYKELGEAVTHEAAQWDGWGTALKPAFEPIVLARKPLVGTVAGNVLAHGTGAINVDACRVEAGDLEELQKNWDRTQSANQGIASTGLAQIDLSDRKPAGRWP
ncbi:MAG TPA: DNA methyltransferase, partial [Beutenbergiaceae bacterium]|nr:DNA methyltransferase [Beutenbergiaceae bacterium]